MRCVSLVWSCGIKVCGEGLEGPSVGSAAESQRALEESGVEPDRCQVPNNKKQHSLALWADIMAAR